MVRTVLTSLVLIFLSCTSALCAEIWVTNTGDSGAGSLRQAITDAAPGDTISFSVTGTITLTSGQLEINKNITINGGGSENCTIDGNGTGRIFYISSGGYTVSISGLTITNGSVSDFGGGIENEGNLTLDACMITNCHVTSGAGTGGAVDNYQGSVSINNCRISDCTASQEGGALNSYGGNGAFTVTNSAITNNTANNNGGGLAYRSSGSVSISGCTFSGNKATNSFGGAIMLVTGSLELKNSTLSGNTAGNGGGLVDGTSTALTIDIVNCTIVDNTATLTGGGIAFDQSTANIKNTILASNTAPTGANFYNSTSGGLNSQGYNLCDGVLTAFSGTGDQTGATLNIAVLADNGGNTQTHNLLSGSDAIDAIPEGGNVYNGAPATDQRGTARPQGTHADVGALELYQAASTPPTVTTQAVSAIGTTSATGNGNITGLGTSNPTAHGVCWNTTGTPTTADGVADNGAASSTGAFTSNMTGLNPGTTYYVRAYATSAVGTSYGAQVSFTTTTPVTPPTVTTQAVSAIGTTSATGNGNITGLGTSNPTAHGVCWNTTGTPTTADGVADNGAASSTGAFTSNMTGLNPGTTYYVRAYATSAVGTSYGAQVSFTTTTPVTPPTVTTQAVSAIGTTSATGNGNITGLGTSNPTAHGVCWNTTGTPTTADGVADNGAASSTGAFTSNMTGLNPGTTYYVRAYATSAVGTSYGAQVSFTTTTPVTPPTVSTQAVSAIGTTSATGNGNITGLGTSNPTAHGVCWNTTGTPTTADGVADNGAASSTGAFTSNMTGLNPGTTYYVRAYATSAVGTSYGAQVSFTTTTPVTPPTVTTQAVSAIGTTSATGNGNITGLGTSNPTAHGVCWNTTGTPTTADSVADNGAASSTGAFTSNMTGLNPGTTYYVRAYATSAVGTSYGAQVSFTTTTPVTPPTVTTQAVSAIGTTSATGNGNITGLGTSNPTAHGVCWNTTGTPTTADGVADNGAASSTGAFTSNMTGLNPGTTYYVRAYATSAVGTSYGAQVSFTTTTPVTPPTVTTQAVSAIGTTSATGNGNITGLGTSNPTAHGVCWNTTGTPTTADGVADNGAASSTGAFTSNMTGLNPGTTYYVRAYATSAVGTSYGAQVSFTTTTPVTPPTVTTQAVSAIGTTSATGNGNITGLGTSNPTAHGVCWNTTGTPTTADGVADNGAASSTGAFTSNMTGLNPGTTYYVRAYATSAVGTSYGAQASFATLPILPTVTTQSVTAIDYTSATGHGDITVLGIPNPTAHGICWNITGDPTTEDSKTDEGGVSSTGAFTSVMTELSVETIYYVRAYAANPAGTAYGDEVSFKTGRESLSVSKSGSGSGWISSSPTGIDCGADCSENYVRDTVVRLTATPDDCSVFSGWSGACSGTETCLVVMDRTRSVTATFNPIDTDGDRQPDCEDTDDDNDGIPDEWEIRYGLNPLDPDDARLDPDNDGLDNLGEYLNGSSPEERTEGPGIPVLISPEDGVTGVSLEPELMSDYTDPDFAETHFATRWQIAGDSQFQDIIFDIVSDINRTDVLVPQLIIEQGKTCYFRVCYYDYNDIAWMWSEIRSFTVTSDSFTDQNGNGIPDDQDLPEGTMVDLDGNGINDPEQDGMECIRLSDDETIICCQSTENIHQMDLFMRMDNTAAQLESDNNLHLPFGLFGFRASLEDPGQPVVVTFFSSSPFSDDSRWLKYDSVNDYSDFSNYAQFSADMMSVRLTFTDGNTGDADGCANGIIVDPSGPEETASTGDSEESGASGSGGCFIQSVLY